MWDCGTFDLLSYGTILLLYCGMRFRGTGNFKDFRIASEISRNFKQGIFPLTSM